MVNVYNSHFNEIEKEITRKHSEYLFEQEKFLLSPTRKNTSSYSLSPDELKILQRLSAPTSSWVLASTIGCKNIAMLWSSVALSNAFFI